MWSNVFHMEPHEFTKTVSTSVKAAIEHSEKSQREIADETGIPLVTLNRKLNGAYAFDTTELFRIATCLGVSVSILAGWSNQAETADAA